VVDRGGVASDHNCDEFSLDGMDFSLGTGPQAS